MRIARELGGPGEVLLQEDVFYGAPHGRLKLRQVHGAAGVAARAELIAYSRPDAAGARTSEYLRVAVADPGALHAVLSAACGAGAPLRKRRLLFLTGQTRIHLDEVEGLGQFIELEVVLRPEQAAAEGVAIAEALGRRLRIEAADLIAGAYADLRRT